MAVRALRDKYERMRRLRQLHEHARADPSFVEPDPRAAMAELARDFPGALRELDELPMAEIDRRLALLTAEHIEPWMDAMVTFHALARGALAIKRWLADHEPSEFQAALPGLVPEAALWADSLDAIASPPHGRLMDLVRARLGPEAVALLGSAGAARRRR